MKIMIMLGCLFSIMSSNLVSQENTSEAEIVYDCSESIREVLDEKIYLIPGRVVLDRQQFFLLTNSSNWIPIEEVYEDTIGYYINQKEPIRPNGHTGFRRIGNTWYCFKQGCPYFFWR